MHLFPRDPSRPTLVLPLTRVGFRVVGGWFGPDAPSLAHVRSLVDKLRTGINILLQPNLAIPLQTRLQYFRMCFGAQSRLCHIQRCMIPSVIAPAIAEATALQHDAERRLLSIPYDHLPADHTLAAAHPAATLYRLHLPTDAGGCALTAPILTYLPAAAGAAASAQPILRTSAFHADIAANPLAWPTSGFRILAEPAVAALTIAALPAFFSDPTLYPDRHRAFRNAFTGPDGTATLANLDLISAAHPQACFARTLNRQLAADLVADNTLPDTTRAGLHANAAFNSGRFLIPFYITQDNALTTEETLTAYQTRAGVPLSLIGPSTRCLARCYAYGPHVAFAVPGPLGQHHVTTAWHRSGAHQHSCNIGGYTHFRHQQFLRHLLDGLKAAGAAVDASTASGEVFISPIDNKRADAVIWHPALSARGIAVDTTIWSGLTLPRLAHSAAAADWVTLAAEKHKIDKYRHLCDALNLDFEPLAADPQGGFGPNLRRIWRLCWDHRLAAAAATNRPTRPIVSHERRCLERISTALIRCLHRAIATRLHAPIAVGTAQPPDDDGDAHMPADT